MESSLSEASLPAAATSNGWGARTQRLSLQNSLENQLANLNLEQGISSADGSVIGSRPASVRHSFDLKYFTDQTNSTANALSGQTPNNNHILSTPPKLQSSFSAGEIPTVKTTSTQAPIGTNPNNHAQQHFHNHNASIGRIPAGAMASRHSRELSTDNNGQLSQNELAALHQAAMALQANAVPFGSPAPQAQPQGMAAPNGPPPPYSGPGYFGNGPPYMGPGLGMGAPNGAPYGVGMISAGVQNMHLANGGPYGPQNYPGAYTPMYSPQRNDGRPRDSQQSIMAHRRQMDNEGT